MSVTVTIRMDEEVKARMEEACKEMGLSMTSAINIFAKRVGDDRAIPFEVKAPSAREYSVARLDLDGSFAAE